MPTELYYSPYCAACAEPQGLVAGRDGVVLKDITEHIAEAVSLGIVRPPALVIDGRVVAQGAAALRRLNDASSPHRRPCAASSLMCFQHTLQGISRTGR